MALLRFLLLSFSVAPFAVQGTKPAEDIAAKASICDVIRTPEAFAAKRLILDGIVEGQRADHLILISADCQFGVPLRFAPAVSAHADIQKLLRAMRRGNPGTTDTDITAQVTGHFLVDPEKTFLLDVEKVEDLKTPKP